MTGSEAGGRIRCLRHGTRRIAFVIDDALEGLIAGDAPEDLTLVLRLFGIGSTAREEHAPLALTMRAIERIQRTKSRHDTPTRDYPGNRDAIR